MNAIPVERTGYQITLSDVLANAGSRSIPYFLIDTVDGEEVERLTVAPTTVRAHANRAARPSRVGHEFIFDDYGNIIAAISINEVRGER